MDLIELLNGLTGGQLRLWAAALAPTSAPSSWPPPPCGQPHPASAGWGYAPPPGVSAPDGWVRHAQWVDAVCVGVARL